MTVNLVYWAEEWLAIAGISHRPNAVLAARHGMNLRTAQRRTANARLAGLLPVTTQGRAVNSRGCPLCGAPPSTWRKDPSSSVQSGDALREQEAGLHGPAAPASDPRRLAGAGRSL